MIDFKRSSSMILSFNLHLYVYLKTIVTMCVHFCVDLFMSFRQLHIFSVLK